MDVYENAMVESRSAFANRIGGLTKGITPQALSFFLYYYLQASQAIHLGFSESYAAAAKSQSALGFQELAEALEREAAIEQAEAVALKKDFAQWVSWMQAKHFFSTENQTLLTNEAMPALKKLMEFQKALSQGSDPFILEAAAYEFARTAQIHSFTLIKLMSLKLGGQVLRRMGFIFRTAIKRGLERPGKRASVDALSTLQARSSELLKVYGDFLEELAALSIKAAQTYETLATVE